MKKGVFLLVLLVLLVSGSYITYRFYPYLFAKTVQGRIIGVERVLDPTMIIGSSKTISDQAFSFAVAIQSQETREIYTASSEDRQWGVAVKGQCAQARFFANPPWDLEKGGTFFGARLIRLFECPADVPPAPVAPSGVAPQAGAPGAVPAASPAPGQATY